MTLKTRMLVMALVPIFVVIGLLLWITYFAAAEREIARIQRVNVGLILKTSALITSVQKERGMTSIFLGGGVTINELKEIRSKTDELLTSFKSSLSQAKIRSELLKQGEEIPRLISELRNKAEAKKEMQAVFSGYTQVIDDLIAIEAAPAQAKTTGGVGKTMLSIQVLELAKENAAKLRGFGSGLIARRKPISEEEFNQLTLFFANTYSLLNSPLIVLPGDLMTQLKSILTGSVFGNAQALAKKLFNEAPQGSFSVREREFFDSWTAFISQMDELIGKACQSADNQSRKLDQEGGKKLLVLGLAGCVLVLLVLGIGFLSYRKTVSVLNQGVRKVEEASIEILNSSSQVAATSSEQAEGSQRQAAAIEESSAASEEMASQLKMTAENLRELHRLSDFTLNSMAETQKALSETAEALKKVVENSESAMKIIKSIDEIAFQTNILALNAAVEAARAGEAGAGFAVVADEVRNLALRASKASKETQGVIQTVVQAVYRVNNLTDQSLKVFHQMAEDVNKVIEIVKGIFAAAEEQSKGVEQLNLALGELNQVVQENAARAQELASVSSELEGQTKVLSAVVENLVNFAGLSKKQSKGPEVQKEIHGKQVQKPSKVKELPGLTKKVEKEDQKVPLGQKQPPKELRPEDIIPLDDEELAKF